MRYVYVTLLFVSMCLGQQTSTIFQQVVSSNVPCVSSGGSGTVCSGTILPLPFASTTMRAIGQANHATSITLTNAPAQVCVGGVVDWGMEYSFDNVTFTRFGDQTTLLNINADLQYTVVINAYGAYPYVRLKIRAFDSTNCVLTASYSGVVAGQATITLTAGAVSVSNTPTVRGTSGYASDYNSGLIVVPDTLTAVTALPILIEGIWCNNKTANGVTLAVTNTAASTYLVGSSGTSVYTFPGGANGFILNGFKGLPITGVKWIAGTASALYCQIVGLQ